MNLLKRNRGYVDIGSSKHDSCNDSQVIEVSSPQSLLKKSLHHSSSSTVPSLASTVPTTPSSTPSSSCDRKTLENAANYSDGNDYYIPPSALEPMNLFDCAGPSADVHEDGSTSQDKGTSRNEVILTSISADTEGNAETNEDSEREIDIRCQQHEELKIPQTETVLKPCPAKGSSNAKDSLKKLRQTMGQNNFQYDEFLEMNCGDTLNPDIESVTSELTNDIRPYQRRDKKSHHVKRNSFGEIIGDKMNYQMTYLGLLMDSFCVHPITKRCGNIKDSE